MSIDNKAVNAIRFLAADTVQKANSGHPGLPLGAAPFTYSLFAYHLHHNPKNPNWINRDRFILSAGHGSALLYAINHVFGYGLTIDDLKNFRQFQSKTPGHPEYKETAGVETSTGPLGQGVANAVGMALAETVLAEKFNKDGFKLIDHHTFALVGDGCLMEGISSEAASIAGSMKLNKLIVLYDSNNITIEGDTAITFTENVRKRYEAYGWNTLFVDDGNNLEAINKAISAAKNSDKPTLIEIKTKIGFGAPNKQGKPSAHGEPLGEEEIKLMKANLNWPHEESFYVPEEVSKYINDGLKFGAQKEDKWNKLLSDYAKKYPELSKEFKQWFSDKIEHDFLNDANYMKAEGNIATRISSEQALNKIAQILPNFIGGSADLAPSNKCMLKGLGDYSKDNRSGRNIHYGVREFAMTAISNGIALHGGLRNFIAGFFVFSDYMKPAMRMAALMGLPVIYVFTHDSIGVGEDGPTHQPIEQIAGLRAVPNLTVIRPCDTHETLAAYAVALKRNCPTAIILSRQDLPLLKETGKELEKGAYVLKDEKKPDVILIGTGSEVSLCYEAASKLTEKGIKAKVVSMPSWELFEEQSEAYKESVLPKSITKRVVVEAASSLGWHKYAKDNGAIISIDTFGHSAPAKKLFEHFGLTVENVVNTAIEVVNKK